MSPDQDGTDPPWGGRRVLVVGASAGIGRAVVLRAAALGAEVVAVARRGNRLTDLAGEVAAAGSAGSVIAVTADVTRPGDGAALAEQIAVDGPLDAVVYAAGCATLRRLADMASTDWERILTTNLVGFNQVMAALVSTVSTVSTGSTVAGCLADQAVVAALSSEVVGRPRHGLAAYGVSKAALEESILAWRLEQPQLRFCRVRVGATQPTDFGSDFDAEALGPILEDWVRNGLLPTAFMETAELATVLVDVVGSMVTYPGITVEDLLLRPSAPALADVAELGADPQPDRPSGTGP